MSRRVILLRLLREAGRHGVTTNEILEAGIGSRYSARLLELRREGHKIAAERLRNGQWRYELLDGPAPLPPAPTPQSDDLAIAGGDDEENLRPANRPTGQPVNPIDGDDTDLELFSAAQGPPVSAINDCDEALG